MRTVVEADLDCTQLVITATFIVICVVYRYCCVLLLNLTIVNVAALDDPLPFVVLFIGEILTLPVVLFVVWCVIIVVLADW